ncbi:Uncharacterised protein [Bordetella pertussis]|nr:Uncharacterised protein [Bordetella pertussis]
MIRRFAAHGATPPGHIVDPAHARQKRSANALGALEVEMEALAAHACGAANGRCNWRNPPGRWPGAAVSRRTGFG